MDLVLLASPALAFKEVNEEYLFLVWRVEEKRNAVGETAAGREAVDFVSLQQVLE